ncbi:MAG: GTP-binding protein [Candidatus Hodarchaeales archaeon]
MVGRVLRIKMLLIGDGGVGKSAFRRTWLGETFQTQYLMTLGADFASKEISLLYSPTKTTYTIKFQIWDLAGQPRFKVVSDLYYKGAVGALCFFDITNQESFINLENWIKSFWELNGQGKRPIVIVGAKSDLREDPIFQEKVSPEHGTEYAKELTEIVQRDKGFTINYVETSALRDVNVDLTFRLLATEIISSVEFRRKLQKRKKNH